MRTLFLLAFFVGLSSFAADKANHTRNMSCDQLLASQQVRDLVIMNLNQLHQFPGQWAIASQQLMVELIGYFKNPHFDLVYFERLFRAEGIPLYLVASSNDPGPGLRIGYPPALEAIKEGVPPKYYLWVGVRGQLEADDFKASLGISDEENLRRLAETGFLMTSDIAAVKDNPQVKVADDQTIQDLKDVEVKHPFSRDNN